MEPVNCHGTGIRKGIWYGMKFAIETDMELKMKSEIEPKMITEG